MLQGKLQLPCSSSPQTELKADLQRSAPHITDRAVLTIALIHHLRATTLWHAIFHHMLCRIWHRLRSSRSILHNTLSSVLSDIRSFFSGSY